MKRASMIIALAACGGSPKPQPEPQPIHNTAEPAEPADMGNARVVSDTQPGGVITLEGDREQAMQKAHAEMTAACGADRYTITQEGEEAVNPEGAPVETAWRVHYVCNK